MATLRFNLNGRTVEREFSREPRTLLADFLREDLGLLGVHLGCEQGICGVCTVLVDGQPVKSCLMLAVQADGCEITTVEGLASGDTLSPLQLCFQAHHALQCGFCTPGMLLVAHSLIESVPLPRADEVRAAIAGNLCRCTGYQPIVEAILQAAAERHESGGDDAR